MTTTQWTNRGGLTMDLAPKSTLGNGWKWREWWYHSRHVMTCHLILWTNGLRTNLDFTLDITENKKNMLLELFTVRILHLFLENGWIPKLTIVMCHALNFLRYQVSVLTQMVTFEPWFWSRWLQNCWWVIQAFWVKVGWWYTLSSFLWEFEWHCWMRWMFHGSNSKRLDWTGLDGTCWIFWDEHGCHGCKQHNSSEQIGIPDRNHVLFLFGSCGDRMNWDI